MLVRPRVIRGITYDAVVESYRDGGNLRHRQGLALGASPDLEQGMAETHRWLRRLRTRRNPRLTGHLAGRLTSMRITSVV